VGERVCDEGISGINSGYWLLVTGYWLLAKYNSYDLI